MIQLLTAVALAGALFLVALRRPQDAVLILLCLVPFHGLLKIAPVTISFWKEGAILAILAASLLPRNTPSAAGYRAHLSWTAPLFILVPFGIASALIAHGSGSFFPIKIAYFYLLMIFIVWRHPFTAKDKDRLITILIVTGTIAALYGLLQQMLQGERLVAMGYEWAKEVRTTGPLLRSFGTFNQPFPFGLYLMIALLAGVSASLLEPNRLRSRLFWPLSVIMVVGLILSVVRASYIGLVVGLIVLGVTQHRRVLKLVLGVLAAAVGVIVVAGVALSNSQAVQALFSSSSLQQRLGHWTDALRIALTHPLGTGLGSTGSSAYRIGPGLDVLNPPYQPDSQYLKIALELGPIGMALYIAVVVFIVISLQQLLHRLPTHSIDFSFVCISLAATIAACISAAFATYLEIFPLDLLFWTLPAIACCVPTAARTMSEPAQERVVSTRVPVEAADAS
ncbi:O-antigen ligase family protein [Corynebacterium sanguinis]